jgi:hypothetical protein
MRRAATRRVPQRDGIDIERQRGETNRVDFIRIELELADTFCKLALNSHSPERKRQHEFNAHRALESALHTLTKVHLKDKETEQIVVQIEEVKALLETLEGNGRTCLKC